MYWFYVLMQEEGESFTWYMIFFVSLGRLCIGNKESLVLWYGFGMNYEGRLDNMFRYRDEAPFWRNIMFTSQ